MTGTPGSATPSVTQRVALLTGGSYWTTRAAPELGLAAMTLSDGPVGVRGTRSDADARSTCLPAPVALGASWDEELVHRVAGVLAVEARDKRVEVVLAPMVNLQRSPLGGRHSECFSEDPLLTGRMGVAVVRGIQAGGVAATAKHYVGNDAETHRSTVDVRVDERALREVYLAPFELLVTEGRVWAVMVAYNTVNGVPMTHNPLLTDPLRTEWGFDGVTLSDWYAARPEHADRAIAAGLGLVMPGPAADWQAAARAALRDGRAPARAVHDAVRRLLALGSRVGAVRPVAHEPSACDPSWRDGPRGGVAGLVREAAAAGMVLLHNDGGLLPLDRTGLGRVAVFGPVADAGWIRGGGSATAVGRVGVSPLTGIVDAIGAPRVTYAAGVTGVERLHPLDGRLARCPHCGRPGIAVRYRDGTGRVVGTEHRGSGALQWIGDDVPRGLTLELSARLTADTTGDWAIGFAGVGSFRLALDREPALDVVITPDDDNFALSLVDPPQRWARLPLAAGETVTIELRAADFVPAERFATLVLGVRRPLPAAQQLAGVAEIARSADVCVVVVGTGPHVESEGRDRTDLALPGGQDELVEAVAAANPRTVVVINAGAPVLLPWRDRIAAVLVAWYPGQEFGTALADVLFGAVEPGGRLPCTWPARLADAPVPTTRPRDGALVYTEGVHVGHRSWLRSGVRAAYPFGHGLGYTSWAYLGLDVLRPIRPDGRATVSVRLRNTGSRAGKEVVQVYLSRPDSAVERPVRWLAGFAVARLAPGTEAAVSVSLAARAFQHWSVRERRWVTEPGRFRVHAGRSVDDLPLAADLVVASADAS